jgi:hypothetical protein
MEMRKVLTLAVSILVCAGASSANAGARDDCADTNGTWLNKRCFCPDSTKLEGTKCAPQVCKDEKQAVPAAEKRKKRVMKALPETQAPTCSLDKDGVIMAEKPDETIVIAVDCDAGTSTINKVIAKCVNECTFDGGFVKQDRKQKASKQPVQTHEVFMVKPNDPKGGITASTVFVAEAKDAVSKPVSVTIKWPLPPPPPAPKKSQTEIDCEADGGSFQNGLCVCIPPKVNVPWVDTSGKLHFCKDPEPPKPVIVPKDGKDCTAGKDGVTKVVHEGIGSAFVLKLVGTGILIDKGLATGLGLMAGGSFGLGSDRWRFNFAGGLMLAPTPEYDDSGLLTRSESGETVKNNSGFLADAGVSYVPIRSLEIGLGVGYWRYGQHWSGPNSGKGTFEAVAAEGEIIYYPLLGEHMSFGLSFAPMLGGVWGGKSPDARMTSGGTLALRCLFR